MTFSIVKLSIALTMIKWYNQFPCRNGGNKMKDFTTNKNEKEKYIKEVKKVKLSQDDQGLGK